MPPPMAMAASTTPSKWVPVGSSTGAPTAVDPSGAGGPGPSPASPERPTLGPRPTSSPATPSPAASAPLSRRRALAELNGDDFEQCGDLRLEKHVAKEGQGLGEAKEFDRSC